MEKVVVRIIKRLRGVRVSTEWGAIVRVGYWLEWETSERRRIKNLHRLGGLQ